MVQIEHRPETGPAKTAGRLPSLTGMRFIAAALVFCVHSLVEGLFGAPSAAGWFKPLFMTAGAGVGFFFVLSGFVLAWSARPRDRPANFLRRRFLKIYPNHLITLAVAVLVMVFILHQHPDGLPGLANVVLVQAWVPDLAYYSSYNGVAWSLSCEMLFYLAFPLLFALIRKIRRERLWYWVAGVVVAVFLVPLLAKALPAQPAVPAFGVSQLQIWFIYMFPPVRLLDFVLGMLLARVVRSGLKLPLSFRGSVLLVIAAAVAGQFLPMDYGLVAIMVVPLGLVIASGAVADGAGRRTGLAGRGWRVLGELSFAFYLWHRDVLALVHQIFGGPGTSFGTPAALGIAALAFAVAVGISWLTFRFFEHPIMLRAFRRGGA